MCAVATGIGKVGKCVPKEKDKPTKITVPYKEAMDAFMRTPRLKRSPKRRSDPDWRTKAFDSARDSGYKVLALTSQSSMPSRNSNPKKAEIPAPKKPAGRVMIPG